MGRFLSAPVNWWRGYRRRLATDRGWVGYAPDDPCYSGAGPVVRAEVEQYLRKRRAVASPDPKTGCYRDLTGIAISGGGVRSATFALGVLQAFAYKDWLKGFDYLSTVSGGGYIGTALTWLLSRDWQRCPEPGVEGGTLRFGLNKCDFPFSTNPLWTAKPDECASTVEANPHRPTRRDIGALLRFLRQNASYLTPGGGITRLSLVAALLRSITMSLAIYAGILAVVFFVLQSLGVFANESADPAVARPLVWAGWAAVVFAVMMVGYVVTSRIRNYSLRRVADVLYPKILIVVAGLLVVGSLPHAYAALKSEFLIRLLSETLGAEWLPPLVGLVSTVLGALFGGGAYRQTAQDGKKGGLLTALVVVGSTLLLYGITLLAYSIAEMMHVENQPWSVAVAGREVHFGWAVAAVAVVAWLAELNYVSMHRYYRDRLMETFMPNVEEVLKLEGGSTCRSPEANKQEISAVYDQRLGDIGKKVDPSCCAPYHLINTNVVLVGSSKPKFRGRGGDNFILSPLYCGSNATGWRDSRRYMGSKLSLATAMAVSGAAVNPSTGVGGEGPTRQSLLSVLMALLNIRLGFWMPNPNPVESLGWRRPNFLWPGLVELVLRSRLRETSSMLEVTDGGHFENLGLYELLRRRLRLIVAIDGAADPAYSFGDLANAIEKARTDFGVKIEIMDIDLEPLVSQRPADARAGDWLFDRCAERGYLAAKIAYPDADPGILVFITTTYAGQRANTTNLTADVYSYRHAHREFPDEPTSDQFFDEKQFEAYRELGFQLAWNMFLEAERDMPERWAEVVGWLQRSRGARAARRARAGEKG